MLQQSSTETQLLLARVHLPYQIVLPSCVTSGGRVIVLSLLQAGRTLKGCPYPLLAAGRSASLCTTILFVSSGHFQTLPSKQKHLLTLPNNLLRVINYAGSMHRPGRKVADSGNNMATTAVSDASFRHR